jgi:uncharacterized protein YjbI with pentapeptide repeats
VAEPQQPWQGLRRWRDHWPRWLLLTAVLAVLVGVVWWRWGLAIASGIALVGGWIVWAVVVRPGRLAPPLGKPELDELPDAKARLEAKDARTRLHHDLSNGPLQWLTVLAVLVGALVGFQQLAEDRYQARQQLVEDRDKAIQDRQLTRQGQASERFTRAIDQLGSTSVETRIGGIYGLDQIAEQSPENTGPVGEVLLAWLNNRPRPDSRPKTQLREHAPDVQAALTVLTGGRYASIVANRLNLQGLGLRDADLGDAALGSANLRDADLRDANLGSADLLEADLRGAILVDAFLTDAKLVAADLRNADLRNAILVGARLHHANLRGADLRGALLRGADLGGADLGGADLRGAVLDGAGLRGADLRGADLRGADLDGADLRGVKEDGRTRWPPGGIRGQAPSSSG